MTASDRQTVVSDRSVVSSLGADVVTCCAAARAGLTRPAELPFYVPGEEREPDEPAIGHPADLMARGFDGSGRLLRLFSVALDKLETSNVGAEPVDLYLAVPNPQRRAQTLARVRDEAQRDTVADQLSPPEREPASVATTQHFVAEAVRLSQSELSPTLRAVFSSGNTALAEAVAAAGKDLNAGKSQLALVGVVDSYVTSSALAWLESTRRIKTAANPVGVQPGEAACLFLLEHRSQAQTAGRTPYAVVDGAQVLDGPESFQDLTSAVGSGLAQVLSLARRNFSRAQSVPPWLVADLNGEQFRAADFGNALVRLLGEDPAWGEVDTVIPALSFGDTGSAGAGLGCLMAMHAFWRGYAQRPHALVVSCGDGRRRAAISIRAA